MAETDGALAGVWVLDLSRVRAGPTCVRTLADFRADVIRVKRPPGVDPNDTMFADKQRGGDFQNLNRNKRGLTLRLKTLRGIEILYKLARTADVVVENWRPDVKCRLGLVYETLSRLNPKIILASLSRFGQDRPYAKRPGFDQVIQGMGGLMSVTGTTESGPTRAGIAVADSSTELYAALGILTALFERERSGEGQWVQANLLHSQIAMLDLHAARYLVEGEVPKPAGNNHPTAAPIEAFLGSDGSFNLGVSGNGQWVVLCRALAREDWITWVQYKTNEARLRNGSLLNKDLQSLFAGQEVSHRVELLNSVGIRSDPVHADQIFQLKMPHRDAVVSSCLRCVHRRFAA